MSLRSVSTSARRSSPSRWSSAQPVKRSRPGRARLARRVVGVEGVAEHVGPERRALRGHALQLESAAGAEVVVGLELVRQVRRFLRLRARQRPGADDVVLLLHLALFEHHRHEQRLEVGGERVGLLRGAALGDERLPVLQERIEHRPLGQEDQPAVEELVVELVLADDLVLVLLRLAGDLPRRLHVAAGLEGERLGQLLRLGVRELAQQLLLLLERLLLGRVFVDDRLRRQRVLVVLGVQEHAGQRVVVLGGNGIVLVVVAAGAAHGEAQEAAAHRVHAVVALVGVGDLDRAVVVVPRPQPQEPERRQVAHAIAALEQVGGKLRGDELVVGQVVVERANHPVAIEVRIGIGIEAAAHRIEAAVVVFAVARHVEPHAAPRLAVAGRRQQAVDDLLVGVGRGVGEEGVDLFRRGRQAREVERHAPQQRALVGVTHRCEALGLELREHEPIDVGARPGGGLHRRRAGALQRTERPERALLGRDDLLARAAGAAAALAAVVDDAGHGAPARTHSTSSSMSAAGSLARPFGMAGKPVACCSTLMSVLSSGLPGSMTAPVSPPLEQRLARIEAQAAHGALGVAGVAVGGEQRPDARLEDVGGLHGQCRLCRRRRRRRLRGGVGGRPGRQRAVQGRGPDQQRGSEGDRRRRHR